MTIGVGAGGGAAGGSVSMSAGNTAGESGVGGSVRLAGGTGRTGGNVELRSGSGSSGAAGDVSVEGGSVRMNAGTSGDVSVSAGSAGSGAGSQGGFCDADERTGRRRRHCVKRWQRKRSCRSRLALRSVARAVRLRLRRALRAAGQGRRGGHLGWRGRQWRQRPLSAGATSASGAAGGSVSVIGGKWC